MKGVRETIQYYFYVYAFGTINKTKRQQHRQNKTETLGLSSIEHKNKAMYELNNIFTWHKGTMYRPVLI